MADDWAAFNPQPAGPPVNLDAHGAWREERSASQSDDPWAAFSPQAAPKATGSMDSPAASDALPEAFVARTQWGQALGRIVNAGAQEAGNVARQAWSATPLGFSDEDIGTLQKWGIFHDPAYGKGNPAQFAAEAAGFGLAEGWQAIGIGLTAGVRGVGAAIGQAATEFGESQGMAQRAQDEATNAGNWVLIETGFGRFARVRSTDMGPQIQNIGGLPRAEDFSNAAGALQAGEGTPPTFIQQRLQTLWQEKGIHPAEAVQDAQTDAFLRHDLTAPAETMRFYHGASAEAVPTDYPAWLTPNEDYARNYRGGPNAVHFVDLSPEEAAAQGGIDEINGNRPAQFSGRSRYLGKVASIG